jgi:cob(I)alamin adenosyltransferase
MESVTLKNINEILKDAPENILERVLGYIEGILQEEKSNFKLSEEQIKSLQKIKKDLTINLPKLKLFLMK